MNVFCYCISRPQQNTVEIGLCLTCQTDLLSAKSPNEQGSREILPFMTLSQVTHHSEHFPRTQVPTGGKKKTTAYFCAYICAHTHTCEYVHVSLFALQPRSTIP